MLEQADVPGEFRDTETGEIVTLVDWQEMSAAEWIAKHGEPVPIEPNPLMPPERN